jgi:hypothetical protein
MKILNKTAVTFLLFALSACSKEKKQPNYLKANVNGSLVECNIGFNATKGAAGNKTIFFEGKNAQYSFNLFLDGQGSDITSGSYDFVTGIPRSATLYEGNDGYGAGYYTCLVPPCLLQGSGRITIQGIDKKHVQGTFEFITATNSFTGQFKTVTNGSFYINRD